MDDNSLVFSRIDALLGRQAAIDGVRTLTIAGYRFTSVEGAPFNTVDPSLEGLTNGTQAHRDEFVDDLVRQWLAAVGVPAAAAEPAEVAP